MGYEDAARAAHMISSHTVIGVHYNTFPYIVIDEELVKAHFQRNGLDLKLPGIGESIKI
jgi:L-ascorbate metabolism protein UlaG (beta-lactamase superfamily)